MSSRANYTDGATAACRRSDCQLSANRGCHVVITTDPYGRNLCCQKKLAGINIRQIQKVQHLSQDIKCSSEQ
jgi:hypothetical protein